MFWSKFYHFITRHISFISTFYVVFSICFKIITKHYLKSWFRPSWAVLDQLSTSTCQFKCQAEGTKSRDDSRPIAKQYYQVGGENETNLKDWTFSSGVKTKWKKLLRENWTLITKFFGCLSFQVKGWEKIFHEKNCIIVRFQDLSCKLKARESSSTRHLLKQCPKMQGQTRMVNSSLPIPH
jgi:hypothetical protein